jgi:hypothetical protein
MEEKKIPFPQADDLSKVFKILMFSIKKENISTDNLSIYFGFSTRQSSYYLASLRFIGLLDNDNNLKNEYNYLAEISTKRLKLVFISEIVKKPVFSEVFLSKVLFNEDLSRETIAQLIREKFLVNNDVVNTRRAQTVLSWVNSIINNSF